MSIFLNLQTPSHLTQGLTSPNQKQLEEEEEPWDWSKLRFLVSQLSKLRFLIGQLSK